MPRETRRLPELARGTSQHRRYLARFFAASAAQAVPAEPVRRSNGSIAIPSWELLVPFPRARDDHFEVFEFGAPAKFMFDFPGSGDEARRIAWPARFFHDWNIAAGYAPADIDHLAHA